MPSLDRIASSPARVAPGAVIRYSLGRCSLGALLVAASERGICAIQLGDEAEALTDALKTQFPRATLALLEDDGALLAEVASFIDSPGSDLERPLDIRGTEFQLRVWQALREIPPGHTTTYSELAKRIGAPDAVRAVAGACGANRIAVAIPCHRVIRRNGDLSGYRWGVNRKRELLRREAALYPQTSRAAAGSRA